MWGFFRDYPFLQWLGENRRLNTFLENPAKYYNRSTPWYFRAQNYMAFDLGLDFEDNSQEYIQKAISLMEQRFGLVLLTDYFEESLILLKGNVFTFMFQRNLSFFHFKSIVLNIILRQFFLIRVSSSQLLCYTYS